MKHFNGKLIAAFSSFLLASTCLVASTFAWFALSNSLIVDNFEISLKSSQHLEIGFYSTDPSLKAKYGEKVGEWVDDIFYVNPEGSVTTEILKDFNQYNPQTVFEPLSSAYNSAYMGAASAGYLPVLTKMPTPIDIKGERMAGKHENSYLQFECYVRSTKNDVYVFIDKDTSIVPDVVTNAEVATDKEISIDRLNKVVDYMRLSFYSFDARDTYGRQYFTIYEPSPSNNVNEDYQKTPYFGRLDIDPSDGYYDYNYLTGNEIVYGCYEGQAVYSESGRASSIPDINDGFSALSHHECNPFSLEESIENGFVGQYEEKHTPDMIADNTYHSDLSNSIGYIGHNQSERFVITCWAEGWDRDCNVLSSEASFEISIALTAESSDRYF